MLKMLADLGTMKWVDYKDYINGNKIEEAEVVEEIKTVKPQVKKGQNNINPFEIKKEVENIKVEKTIDTSKLEAITLKEDSEEVPF
jgi:hypothetical protein